MPAQTTCLSSITQLHGAKVSTDGHVIWFLALIRVYGNTVFGIDTSIRQYSKILCSRIERKLLFPLA
jgi:hypothetical protein